MMDHNQLILPNFFILGVAKSGTTTLADALRQHPKVYFPIIKEPTFFSGDENYSKGLPWYAENFFEGAQGYPCRGEASPSYLYFAEKTAERIQRDIPRENLKFIIIFRNPVDRAYSHYWHNVHRGHQEPLTFEQALAAEPNRLKQANDELNRLGRIRYAYFQAGLYPEQLRTYWRYFEPERFLLLLQEDLSSAQFQSTISMIHEFLGLQIYRAHYQHSNSSYVVKDRSVDGLIRKRLWVKDVFKKFLPFHVRFRIKSYFLGLNTKSAKYPPMNPETRKQLLKEYTPSIQEFQKMLGRDLSTWLDDKGA